MKKFNCYLFVIILCAANSFAASFTTLDNYMNWNQGISGAMVSDDASTIFISYGSGGRALWKLGVVTYPNVSFSDMTPDGSILMGTNSGQVFTYQSGTINYLGNGTGWDISADGTVIGGKNTSVHGQGQACIWVNGTRQDLGFLSSEHYYSQVSDISSNGQTVIGFSRPSYYFEGGTMPFIWSGTNMEPLPAVAGVEEWMPRAISSDGTTVAGTFYNGSRYEACMYSDGSTTPLGIPDGYISSLLCDLTANGSIAVGWCGLANYDYEAVIWDEFNGIQSLKTFLEDEWGLTLTGWTLENAYGISEDGTMIYGNGQDPEGHYTYWIAEVPEPAAILLFGIGGVVLIKNQRNGRRKQQII